MIASVSMQDWIVWGGLALLSVLMVGVYSGLETSLYVLNRIRLELKSHTGDRHARYLRKMYRKPNRLLAVLLIGTNIFSYIGTFAISVLVLKSDVSEDRVEFYTIAIATPLMFAFSDAVPKNISRIIAERISYGLCWMLRISDIVFTFTGVSPLLQILSGMWVKLLGRRGSGADIGLAAVISEAHASGVLTSSQSAMAGRVMSLGEIRISDVMQPKKIVISVPYDADDEKLIEMIRSTRYSRLPVLSPDGRFTGMVDIYDVLADGCLGNIKKYATMPMYVNADDAIPQTLYEMQKARKHIAVVLGKNGEHVGIVTIKDLVEEIVGEIREWQFFMKKDTFMSLSLPPAMPSNDGQGYDF